MFVRVATRLSKLFMAKIAEATIPRESVARFIAEGGDGVTPQTADPDHCFLQID